MDGRFGQTLGAAGGAWKEVLATVNVGDDFRKVRGRLEGKDGKHRGQLYPHQLRSSNSVLRTPY